MKHISWSFEETSINGMLYGQHLPYSSKEALHYNYDVLSNGCGSAIQRVLPPMTNKNYFTRRN